MHAVRITHISDLHFDHEQKNKQTWRFLADYLKNDIRPDLILVTGDIVDTPDDQLYETAKLALQDLCQDIRNTNGTQYFVCPGNHDRHPHGNAPPLPKSGWFRRLIARRVRRQLQKNSDAFDRVFQGRIPLLDRDQRFNIALGPAENRWNLRILGMDSSTNADVSARGYIDYDEIAGIKHAMAEADNVDFSVLLVHHHLLPVRSLENARKGSIADLAALTPLVNAGTLVETLAAAHVDVALHGHEHAANWGRYATFEFGGGETNIVGAGSATGAITLKPCDQSRASFNVIELREDRTLGLNVYRCDGARWDVGPRFELYDSQALRRARFLRRARGEIRGKLVSDVVRYIEFTRERDGNVRETRTHVDFSKDPRLILRARNTTGTPTDLKIRLTSPNGTVWEPSEETAFETTSQENVFNYMCGLPPEVANALQKVEFSYRWFGGGVLTAEELESIEPGRRGEFRQEGYEFGAITVDGYFRELRLVVMVPPEFAPADELKDVEVILQGENGSNLQPQPDVVSRLRPVGHGLYTLVIPYPRRGYRYGIKWKVPRSRPFHELARKFIQKAQTDGGNLAEVFHRGLVESGISGPCTVAIYVPDAYRRFLEIAGFHPESASPPGSVNAGLVDNVIAQAWRGVSTGVTRQSSGNGSQNVGYQPDVGFQPGEEALLAIPVRFGLGWTNDPPWGIVRIGLHRLTGELASMRELASRNTLRNSLMRPMILMLSEAGIGLG